MIAHLVGSRDLAQLFVAQFQGFLKVPLGHSQHDAIVEHLVAGYIRNACQLIIVRNGVDSLGRLTILLHIKVVIITPTLVHIKEVQQIVLQDCGCVQIL